MAAPFTNGINGVTVFFVISGFLLYRPFLNAQLNGAPRQRVRDFYRRRVLRIVPAYWLALTVLAIYPGLAGVFTHDWWKYYFLVSGYSGSTVGQGLLVSWSLGVEVTFYLVLPLYAIVIERSTRSLAVGRRLQIELVVLAALSLASTVLRYVDFTTARTDAVENALPGLFYWFALGMALAVVSAAVQQGRWSRAAGVIARRPGVCWAGALGSYALLCIIDGNDHTFSTAQWILGYYLLSGIAALLLVVPAVLGDAGGGWPRRVMAWRTLGWLGLISYGIYLWHVPLEVIGVDHGIHNAVALVIVAGIVTTVCAAASYYVVERPILRLK